MTNDMTDEARENILNKYNLLSSWMLWDSELPDDKIDWGKVKTHCVFVALNPSDEAAGKWLSFHTDSRGDANLRAAFEGSEYEGCSYDLIKNKNLEGNEVFKTADSKSVVKYMKEHPEIYKRNIDELKEELRCFDKELTIFVFGNEAYKMLAATPDISRDYDVVKIPHFSPRSVYASSSEKYISKIKEKLADRNKHYETIGKANNK